MIHEPECLALNDGSEPDVRTGACVICGVARAAFQRGRNAGAKALVDYLSEDWIKDEYTQRWADVVRGDGK